MHCHISSAMLRRWGYTIHVLHDVYTLACEFVFMQGTHQGLYSGVHVTIGISESELSWLNLMDWSNSLSPFLRVCMNIATWFPFTTWNVYYTHSFYPCSKLLNVYVRTLAGVDKKIRYMPPVYIWNLYIYYTTYIVRALSCDRAVMRVLAHELCLMLLHVHSCIHVWVCVCVCVCVFVCVWNNFG